MAWAGVPVWTQRHSNGPAPRWRAPKRQSPVPLWKQSVAASEAVPAPTLAPLTSAAPKRAAGRPKKLVGQRINATTQAALLQNGWVRAHASLVKLASKAKLYSRDTVSFTDGAAYIVVLQQSNDDAELRVLGAGWDGYRGLCATLRTLLENDAPAPAEMTPLAQLCRLPSTLAAWRCPDPRLQACMLDALCAASMPLSLQGAWDADVTCRAVAAEANGARRHHVTDDVRRELELDTRPPASRFRALPYPEPPRPAGRAERGTQR